MRFEKIVNKIINEGYFLVTIMGRCHRWVVLFKYDEGEFSEQFITCISYDILYLLISFRANECIYFVASVFRLLHIRKRCVTNGFLAL